MQKQIIWEGLFYRSFENCFIKNIDTGTQIISSITGSFKEDIFKAGYQIKVNQNWETEYFNIKSEISGVEILYTYESDGKGSWKKNGYQADEFNGCIDIDISVTPLTNSLPINRLKLNNHDEQIINVIYIDILQQQIKTMHQKYIRLSQFEYKYKNVTDDFKAIITVDEYGFVVDYPELFKRTESSAAKSWM